MERGTKHGAQAEQRWFQGCRVGADQEWGGGGGHEGWAQINRAAWAFATTHRLGTLLLAAGKGGGGGERLYVSLVIFTAGGQSRNGGQPGARAPLGCRVVYRCRRP